jgi:hypothetical protein
VSRLRLTAWEESDRRLRVKITDADKDRYEVPADILPRPGEERGGVTMGGYGAGCWKRWHLPFSTVPRMDSHARAPTAPMFNWINPGGLTVLPRWSVAAVMPGVEGTQSPLYKLVLADEGKPFHFQVRQPPHHTTVTPPRVHAQQLTPIFPCVYVYYGRCVSCQVLRSSDGSALFDSSGAALVFQDQFLQLGTRFVSYLRVSLLWHLNDLVLYTLSCRNNGSQRYR